MFSSMFRAELDAFEKELEYYKKLYEEQKEIIEQLTGTGKPKGYVYMHPFDVAELFNNITISEVYVNYKTTGTKPTDDYITVHGRNIKQSPYIPATSKNFK